MEITRAELVERFKGKFGVAPEMVISAPGRVNLIGEHTDYNMGWVLPMAINRRVWVAGRKIDKQAVRLASENQREFVEVQKTILRQGNWADYPLGVLWSLKESGCSLPGMEMYFWGDVPLGGGLSSSAAIEMATACLAKELCGVKIQRKELVRICQLAENSFVGMRCGAMDQMASALSRKDHALYIDCKDLSYEETPLNLGEHRVVVINSGVGRELTTSGYNKRRAECEEATALLKVKSLRELNVEDLPEIEKLPPPLNKRVRHVVTENERVAEAVDCLKKQDLKEFGKLMIESHKSLRDDYEVSTPELDFLVEASCALEDDGVLGARLTGAGFGGCMIILAHQRALEKLPERVLKPYKDKFNREPELLVTYADDGARME